MEISNQKNPKKNFLKMTKEQEVRIMCDVYNSIIDRRYNAFLADMPVRLHIKKKGKKVAFDSLRTQRPERITNEWYSGTSQQEFEDVLNALLENALENMKWENVTFYGYETGLGVFRMIQLGDTLEFKTKKFRKKYF